MIHINLILDKLNNTISKEDNKIFEAWYSISNENKELFHRLQTLKNSEVDISAIKSLNNKKAWRKVLLKFEAQKKQKRKTFILKTLRYAALIIGVSILGYGAYNQYPTSSSIEPIIDENAITLKLDNGDVKVLSSDNTLAITDKDGNVLGTKVGTKLDYKKVEAKVDKLVYNTLKIPYGKRFEIKLSDGTLVHLNAGSSLRYPVKFIEGEKREVFLIGEAFFDVEKDEKHPFIVNTSKINVTVYGTKFNVSSYPDDNIINTVLLEGSVGISSSLPENKKGKESNEIIRLSPNQKASWNKKNNRIRVKTVDVSIYTSWIKGRLTIKNTRFKNIIKILERHYDVVIVNNYRALDNEAFTSSFDVETIEEVLNAFSDNKKFNFKIENKTITINKP